MQKQILKIMEKLTHGQAVREYDLYQKAMKINDSIYNELKPKWDEYYKCITHYDARHSRTDFYIKWRGFEVSRYSKFGVGMSN